MSRTKNDNVEAFHGYGIHVPTRTIFMGSESSSDYGLDSGTESGTDHAMAERVIKNLHILEQLGNEPIIIIMDNIGGDVWHGRAIYDAIKACRSHVTILVRGHAMSMGAYILQAADHRVMSPGAKIMIHYGHISVHGEALTVYKQIDAYKREDREMERIFLEKIIAKRPDFTIKRLRRMLSNDTFLNAKQAMDIGLADEIEEVK
jgi:ATP-dependent Clp protease protease subunit